MPTHSPSPHSQTLPPHRPPETLDLFNSSCPLKSSLNRLSSPTSRWRQPGLAFNPLICMLNLTLAPPLPPPHPFPSSHTLDSPFPAPLFEYYAFIATLPSPFCCSLTCRFLSFLPVSLTPSPIQPLCSLPSIPSVYVPHLTISCTLSYIPSSFFINLSLSLRINTLRRGSHVHVIETSRVDSVELMTLKFWPTWYDKD